ncbi:MAG: glycosyltransferase family 4 protein, partial [Planctomycetota bacterium]|nr:glycosyltransferase family 4 protein [Planctomycetota bacterium]
MRIGMFAWESLHSIAVGGVAVHVTELAAALQRRGHEVHVFTRASGPAPGYQEIYGVRYHYCPFRLQPSFVDEVMDMCRSFAHFHHETECVTGGFDIVHAHDWLASQAAVWISQAKGRRMILTMHSTEYGRCGNNFYGGPSARIRDIERHGTYCAHRVIAVSQAPVSYTHL